jgi:hypothetical protein
MEWTSVVPAPAGDAIATSKTAAENFIVTLFTTSILRPVQRLFAFRRCIPDRSLADRLLILRSTIIFHEGVVL